MTKKMGRRALDYDFPASYLVTLSARMCRFCSYASFVHIIWLHTDDTLQRFVALHFDGFAAKVS